VTPHGYDVGLRGVLAARAVASLPRPGDGGVGLASGSALSWMARAEYHPSMLQMTNGEDLIGQHGPCLPVQI
jgi:hypothetical protein